MSFVKLLVKALDTFDLDDDINRFVIDRAVNRCRNRPHPWSTKHPYISWSGLTDRTFNARLLPANPYPPVEAMGTRRPPIAEVAKLFEVPVGQRQRRCPKSTGLFPAFAQYLTDGFIRTQLSNDDALTDRRRTTSNHDIDMSPLYGRTPAQTRVLRPVAPLAGERGQLKMQMLGGEAFPPFLYGADGKVAPEFCDAVGMPVLDMPLGLKHVTPAGKAKLFAVGGDRVNAAPQVAMMNTLFLREHNRLAAMLERNNPDWDDERVFETTRNIIIVMFIKIVVEEYINHINTTEFPLQADPTGAWKATWNRPNWMTVEFSLLYRWHALVTEEVSWGGVTMPGGAVLLDNTLLIERGLANSFADVSGNGAAELGLENSASFLLQAEADAIGQARLNDVATYNDYREAMGEKRATSFAAIVGSTDDTAEQLRRTKLAARLQALYDHPDNVEFYVGLFAEPREQNGPLPDLVMGMVAMDAFSQALTNPLLSEHVWGNRKNRELAFTAAGLAEIDVTKCLRDVLKRNAAGLGQHFVGMTRRDWERE
jgi:prostaglandin-endoperoxide synthase 2